MCVYIYIYIYIYNINMHVFIFLFQAQQELANEGVDPDVDKTRAFKKLATTLTKLLGRLEKAEKGRKLSVRV